VKGKIICSPKRGFLRDTQEPLKRNTGEETIPTLPKIHFTQRS